MISALKLRQDPSPHLSKLFSSEYPSAATFLVDTPTDVLPKKNRRYGVDDLDAREAYSSVFKYAPHYPVNDHPRKHRKTRPVVYL